MNWFKLGSSESSPKKDTMSETDFVKNTDIDKYVDTRWMRRDRSMSLSLLLILSHCLCVFNIFSHILNLKLISIFVTVCCLSSLIPVNFFLSYHLFFYLSLSSALSHVPLPYLPLFILSFLSLFSSFFPFSQVLIFKCFCISLHSFLYCHSQA